MSNPGSTAPGADPSRTPSAWTAKSEKDNETPEGVTPDTRSEVEKNEASAARLGRVIGGKYLKKDENEESPASAQHQDHGPLTEVDADIPLTLTEVVNKNGQEYIFIDFADGDQENPFNWNPWYKRFITTILNLMTLFIGLATTAYSSGISSMNKDLNASHTEGQLGLFTFNMTCAVAPMILAPFCELVGRKIVYAGAYLCFSLCFIGLALGQNISTIIVMRCLLGLFGCVGTILVGGTFDDMYQPRERGGPMAMFSFIAIFGTVAAPIYAGFIDQSIGWRWIEGIQGLSNIPLLLVVFIFFPETRGGVYLHKRAKALRKATGDQRYVAAEDINTPTLKSMLKASSVKAVKMLSTEPVVFAFGFWIAFCWGVVFLFLSVIPITFSEKRGWSEGVSGLPYISLCIGTTLGWLANYLQMGKYEKIVQNPDRKVVPEDRLYGAMLGAPLLPIGLFIYSFTQYAFLIWVGPVIALAPIAFGIYFVFESTYSYTADCYDKQQMDPQSSVPPGGLARPRDRRRSGFFSDPRNRIEFAYDDEALIQRLYRSAWLNGKTYGKDYEFPAWLNETPDVIGDPSRISEFRLDVLRDDDKAAANYNEARYVRNRAFIRHIYEAVKTQNQHVGEHNTTSAQPLGATNVTTSQVTTHNAEGTNENDDEVLYLGSRQVPNGNDDDVAFFGSREVAETAATPASISSRSTSSSSMDISEVEAEVLIGSGEGTNDNDDDVAFVGSREGGETAATPVSISSSSTSSSSTDLTQSEAETESTLEIDQAHMPSQTVAQTGGITQRPSGRLERLADVVSQGLSQVIPNDCIQECGQAPLKIIAKRFDEVLTIATERLNTRPFSSVQKCWRRLYEDACLFKAVHLLRVRVASFGGDLSPNQRLELQNAPQDGVWLSEIIAVLDKSLQVSGAPGRRQLHNTIFQQLSEMLPAGEMNKYPPAFRIYEPWPLQTRDGVSKADSTLDLAEFQEWLEFITQPLVIPKVTRHWPASKRWKSPRYLMEHTLGGRRLVPIELGKLYSDKDWSQKMMPFAEFTKKYLLSSRPHEVGYLAQTDLFDLIPALRADIMTPDYCWSTPPVITDEATQKTAGLSSAPYLSEPSVNVWLGPSGTRTPLHTDPYHNILCQVVGFKYVRLYAPHEALKLYPMGVTKEGINMENTSQVDISENVACLLGRNGDANVRREIDRKFPKFKEAQYQEVILNPGDCLYVPLGWWHYVESLTTSSSVNFWWS
ncbi:MFS general substrate transporter [Hortaea werneckii]|nr:MFS general substrate transporter [Hortaea werneckii]KAI6950524.1 MFS general substrate transporter [Hortaea werneckii]KAI6981095.1 MFS general substrate transporter [Hortaea werneckii]KAI6999651.1 MFS general substrate transporter [Hortaea werneckii]KAI7050182.1 MFS general substrate transporter [Hortaea werneckii]